MSSIKRTPVWAFVVGSLLFICLTPVIIGLITSSISIPGNGTLGLDLRPLHTEGHYIYDSSGRRINLWTVCIFNGGGGMGVRLNDVQNIKAMGFNAIRIFIYWGLIQPYNETLNGIDETYFTTAKAPMYASLDDVINWCLLERMYIVCVLRWTDTWLPPSWAFPGLTTDDARYVNLFSSLTSAENVGIQNTWKYIANRYKNYPNVLFEFLNEPCVRSATSYLVGTPYKTFNEQIISAIETVETNSTPHLKLVMTIVDASSSQEYIDEMVDIDKPNVVWTSHQYAPMSTWNPNNYEAILAFTLNSNKLHELYLESKVAKDYLPGNYPDYYPDSTQVLWVAWRQIRIADKVHSFNKPWMDTEWGKDTRQTGWDLWLDICLGIKRDYNIVGWTYFCYCSKYPVGSSTDYFNLNNPAIKASIMNILTPYMTQP